MFDFTQIPSTILFEGTDTCAYRDPAVYYENGRFYLFSTFTEVTPHGIEMTTIESTSEDLIHWTTPRELTPRDPRCNYSSPGNVIRYKDAYYLCLQTYCRENGEKYGNERSRLFTMRSTDLLNWEEPVLLRVKGDDVPEEDMGRMIDPYLVQDLHEPEKWWCLYKQNGVSMSYSYDLEHWTYHGHTESGENVCVLPKDGKYLIFHSPNNGIGVLQTEDFTAFETVGELITLGQKEWDWASGRLTAGFVLDMTNDPDYGKYIMFFHGSLDESITFDNNASIGIAWSDDCIHWQYPKG